MQSLTLLIMGVCVTFTLALPPPHPSLLGSRVVDRDGRILVFAFPESAGIKWGQGEGGHHGEEGEGEHEEEGGHGHEGEHGEEAGHEEAEAGHGHEESSGGHGGHESGDHSYTGCGVGCQGHGDSTHDGHHTEETEETNCLLGGLLCYTHVSVKG